MADPLRRSRPMEPVRLPGPAPQFDLSAVLDLETGEIGPNLWDEVVGNPPGTTPAALEAWEAGCSRRAAATWASRLPGRWAPLRERTPASAATTGTGSGSRSVGKVMQPDRDRAAAADADRDASTPAGRPTTVRVEAAVGELLREDTDADVAIGPSASITAPPMPRRARRQRAGAPAVLAAARGRAPAGRRRRRPKGRSAPASPRRAGSLGQDLEMSPPVAALRVSVVG